jgi:hypothetical protein
MQNNQYCTLLACLGFMLKTTISCANTNLTYTSHEEKEVKSNFKYESKSEK